MSPCHHGVPGSSSRKVYSKGGQHGRTDRLPCSSQIGWTIFSSGTAGMRNLLCHAGRHAAHFHFLCTACPSFHAMVTKATASGILNILCSLKPWHLTVTLEICNKTRHVLFLKERNLHLDPCKKVPLIQYLLPSLFPSQIRCMVPLCWLSVPSSLPHPLSSNSKLDVFEKPSSILCRSGLEKLR